MRKRINYIAINIICLLAIVLSMVNAQVASANDGKLQGAYDDPWQGFNRSVFTLNENLNDHVLRPVATHYVEYTPEPVRGLVSNFFHNLGDVRNFFNALFQLKLENAGISLTRFVLNTTVGQLGMVDVATAIGMPARYEDFGLTLARWHVPSGPYLVLPLFGPGTVRSTVGLVPDISYFYPPFYIDDRTTRNALTALDIVQRSTVLLKSEQLITGDKYIFTRDAYLQRRQFQITGKLPQDDF